jgi:hypothetical protein
VSDRPWQHCYTCRDYLTERRELLAEAMGRAAREQGRDVIEIADEFMAGAHRRHVEEGKPLRPGGPICVTDPDLGRLMATLAMLGANLDAEAIR